MATNNRRAGVAVLSVNGLDLEVKGGLTYSTATESRETLRGQSGVAGYKGMPQAPFVEADVYDDYDLKLSDLSAMTDVTVTLIHANGKTASGSGMWWVGESLDNNTEEGTFKVRFEGPAFEETN